MPRALRGMRSVAFYYGRGSEHVLTSFELAVVQPDNLKTEAVEYMRSKGTRVLGYMSVLEIPRNPHRPVPASALRVGGAPLAQAEFNNWILDPRHPLVRERAYSLAAHIAELGYDGVFLDTIGDVEDRRIPTELRSLLVPAAAHLVAGLAEDVGCGAIVQNWGLYDLLPFTAPYLDGVCWENFPYREIGPLPVLHPGVRRLHAMQEQYGLTVIALNEGLTVGRERELAQAAAERCDFIWYGTENYTLLPVEVGN